MFLSSRARAFVSFYWAYDRGVLIFTCFEQQAWGRSHDLFFVSLRRLLLSPRQRLPCNAQPGPSGGACGV